MTKKRKIKFVCHAIRWFDKVNGNTYHSVRITKTQDGSVVASEWRYGYEDAYRQTALERMSDAGWLPKKYHRDNLLHGSLFMFERENNYPILWNVSNGLKREMINNGVL